MVQARTSLWYLVFIGFAVNYMIRINLNITIVDMIKNHKNSNINNDGKKLSKECLTTTKTKATVSTRTTETTETTEITEIRDTTSDIKNSLTLSSLLSINQEIDGNKNDNKFISSSDDNENISFSSSSSTNLNSVSSSDFSTNYSDTSINDNLYTKNIINHQNNNTINVSNSNDINQNNKNIKNYENNLTTKTSSTNIIQSETTTILNLVNVASFVSTDLMIIDSTVTDVDYNNSAIDNNGNYESTDTSADNKTEATVARNRRMVNLSSNENVKNYLKITNDHEIRSFTIERFTFDALNFKYEKNGFDWNEYEQGLVLGAFFWLHWVTQIPGGILAKKYGTKLVYGLANAIGCWICFLLPFVAYMDYRLLIFFRVLQGLICGLAWPAMHHMTAQWIPPNERSKFVTAYLGSSIGIAIFYPLFGYIMSWTSWEWVYHICGVFGTIWYIMWLYMVYDTPAKHPRISEKERKYIEKSLSGQTTKGNGDEKIPWKCILKSKPVWMNVIAQWGGIWGLFTLMTQAPTYFKLIHGWDIKMTGILSGIPHFMRMIFAYFFSMFGDYLLRTDKMTRTNVRKIATTMCCITKGIFVLALAYSGCNSMAAIVFLTLATAVHGAVSTGPLASIVDIAPNYAGIILGISGMIGVLPGFISPVIVGILTFENQTVTSWKYVFLITSVMLIVSGILYVMACESNTQKWNNPDSQENGSLIDKELKLIVVKGNDICVCSKSSDLDNVLNNKCNNYDKTKQDNLNNGLDPLLKNMK